MARNDRAGATAFPTPGGAGVSPQTAEHKRDAAEVIHLLAIAHRRLDMRGVPRPRRRRMSWRTWRQVRS